MFQIESAFIIRVKKFKKNGLFDPEDEDTIVLENTSDTF
jgi:hypothetical protein